MDEKLVDRIYEAAVLPELWPSVLEDLNEIGEGYATFLFSFTDRLEKWISSARGGYAADYFAENWPTKTDRALRLFNARHAGFLGDLDVYTPEEMDREPVFTEFLRPRGIGWGAATAIEIPNGDSLVFDVERRIETGPVKRKTIGILDTFRPHLARAGLLSTRLAFERARAATVALELIGLPAAILARSHRILAANQSLEKMIPDVIRDRKDRVALMDLNADSLLAVALTKLSDANHSEMVRSLPIPAFEGRPPLILHVLPIRRSAQDVFANAAA